MKEPAETYEPRLLGTHDKYGLSSVLEVEDQADVLADFGTCRARVALPRAKLFKM